jgi:hypothetical protein
MGDKEVLASVVRGGLKLKGSSAPAGKKTAPSKFV